MCISGNDQITEWWTQCQPATSTILCHSRHSVIKAADQMYRKWLQQHFVEQCQCEETSVSCPELSWAGHVSRVTACCVYCNILWSIVTQSSPAPIFTTICISLCHYVKWSAPVCKLHFHCQCIHISHNTTKYLKAPGHYCGLHLA